MATVHHERETLIRHFFPKGMPNLWCPALTHVREDGSFDTRRIESQLNRVADFSSGWLMFGPTGHGDLFSDEDVVTLLAFSGRVAAKNNAFLLASTFATNAEHGLRRANRIVDWLRERSRDVQTPDDDDQSDGLIGAMVATRVMGIAVSAPVQLGTPSECESALRRYLDLGVPTAISQPPTPPENLIPPEVVAGLAADYANFVLFEDSSGQDRVVMSSADLSNVRKFRGASGNYMPWTKSMGGNYDGLMVGAVNGFGLQLSEMLGFLDEGFASHAVNLITPVQRVIDEASSAVAALEFGNRFANTQHAIDHFLAYGREPNSRPSLPLGHEFPSDVLDRVKTVLDENGFLRASGYMS